jgi:YD repeat-containing protein
VRGAGGRNLAPLDDYVPTAEGMSLVELGQTAARIGIPGRIVARSDGAAPAVPSIVHLRIGHFSAVVEHDPITGRYRLDDPAFGYSVWMSAEVLAAETSALAFVPGAEVPEGWRDAGEREASEVRGRSCPPGGPDNEGPCANCGPAGAGGGGGGGNRGNGGGGPNYGMPGYWFSTINAGLMISDVPLSYRPPRGPAVEFGLVYSSRDLLLPQTFTFGNLGAGWFGDWLSYAEEQPASCGIIFNGCAPERVSVLLRSGGLEQYMGAPDTNGAYPTHYRQRATLYRVSSSPIRYERRLADGTVEVFGLADTAPAGQRRVFLTEVIDPHGQALTFTYDAQYRLAAVTDAIGQVTTLTYGLTSDPLKVTLVTDPFGRTAQLDYDSAGRLTAITDTIGLRSSFTYGGHDMIASLTTPYGTTTFSYEADAAALYTTPAVQATDPLGGTERLEFRWEDPTAAATEVGVVVPPGFEAANMDLDRYNTVYWDKRQWAAHPSDPSKATVTKWLLRAIYPGGDVIRSVAVPHSVKRPLENRVWYAYPGQPSAAWAGTHTTPSVTARVLDDGTVQRWERTYNALGQVVTTTDPLGRQTTSTYAANGRDLLEVRQTTGGLTDLLAGFANYTALGQPQTTTDAAGQTTTYTYNAAGQVLTATNAKQETTTYTYDPEGRLSTVTGPVAGATTTYGYDLRGRLMTVTEDGHTVTTLYDTFDRPIRIEYPDGTFETILYDRLDVSSRRDRAGRVTRYYYDPLRRLTATRDPLNRTIQQAWCGCGSLDALVDANGNRTEWVRDVQGRVTREERANGSGTDFIYEQTTSRLKRQTDAKGQHTDYPNNQTSTYNYYPAAADHRLQTIHHKYPGGATLSKFDYTYDPVGNIVTWRQQADNDAVLWTYGYDKADQLTSATKYSTDAQPVVLKRYGYAYDPAGNRTAEQIDDTVTGASHDNMNRLLSHQPAGGLQFAGTVSEPAAVTIQGKPAAVAGDNTFRATVPVASGTNVVTVTATDPSGNTALREYEVDNLGTPRSSRTTRMGT